MVIKNGLTVAGGVIQDWPYDVKKPTKAELTKIVNDYKPIKESLNLEKSKQSLRDACERYQRHPGKCNSNFFALLTAVSSVAKSTGTAVSPKAQACLDWLDSLWAIYYTRKANKDWNHDFSEAGTIPHSFTEVREESEQ